MISVRRMHDQINARANTILWVLFAASGLLFVIACSNVANLVLARTLRRESELAVRSALGANTAALRRSLLAESLVLCGSGVAAALLVAAPMVYDPRPIRRALLRPRRWTLTSTPRSSGSASASRSSPRSSSPTFPRLPSTKASPASGLTGRRHAQCRPAPTAASASSPSRRSPHRSCCSPAPASSPHPLSFWNPRARPLTLRSVLAVNLPPVTYGRTPQQSADFYHEVVRRVSALPGVEQRRDGLQRSLARLAASASASPSPSKAPRARTETRISAPTSALSPRGSSPPSACPSLKAATSATPTKTGPTRVVIISKSVADKLFPGQEADRPQHALDRRRHEVHRHQPRPAPHRWRRPRLRRREHHPQPLHDHLSAHRSGRLGRPPLRAHADRILMRSSPPSRKPFRALSADQPVETRRDLDDVRAEVLTPDKLNAIVFGGFAAVALLISVVGVAGVLASQSADAPASSASAWQWARCPAIFSLT